MTLTVKWFEMQQTRTSFTSVLLVLFIHTTKQFKWNFNKHLNIFSFLLLGKQIAHKMHFLKQNHCSTVLAESVFCRGDNDPCVNYPGL